MIEILAAIIIFSAWAGLWYLLRAEDRLAAEQFKQQKIAFMRDYRGGNDE